MTQVVKWTRLALSTPFFIVGTLSMLVSLIFTYLAFTLLGGRKLALEGMMKAFENLADDCRTKLLAETLTAEEIETLQRARLYEQTGD